MGKIVVPTKFTKTGRRVLTTPVQDKSVSAPADRRYRQACKAIEAEFKRNKDKPLQAYIEKMSHFLASYVASKSASSGDRYRITKFLAQCRLRQSERWSQQLGDIPELSEVDKEAWQAYNNAEKKLWKQRADALDRASYRHGVEKRALWREITHHIHLQCHPEDDTRNH